MAMGVLMVARGVARNLDHAVELMRQVRPRVKLRTTQRKVALAALERLPVRSSSPGVTTVATAANSSIDDRGARLALPQRGFYVPGVRDSPKGSTHRRQALHPSCASVRKNDVSRPTGRSKRHWSACFLLLVTPVGAMHGQRALRTSSARARPARIDEEGY